MARPEVGFVAIGEVLAPHGLRGELKVGLLTDFPERFRKTVSVFVGPPGRDPGGEPVEVERAHLSDRWAIVKLFGVDTVEAAEKLRRQLLYVKRGETAPLPDGSFYIFDLVGLEVRLESGEILGELVEVMSRPANDVFVVRRAGGQEILLPALKSVVHTVDLDAGRMVVILPPGLLDEPEGDRG